MKVSPPPFKDSTKLYRPGVGLMVANQHGQIFVGKRLASIGLDGSNNYQWQMPQGGIDKGEDLLSAAKRELFEETSISSVELIAIIPHWLKYDIPREIGQNFWDGKYIGQKQKWLLMMFRGDEKTEINVATPEPEFSEWKWEDIGNLESIVVPFKRDLYKTVVAFFKPILGKFRNFT